MQKAHPDELFHLLAKVIPFLKSRSWDTRTAAAKALGGIVENAERFNPNADVKKEEDEAADEADEANVGGKSHTVPAASSQDHLHLETLDIWAILSQRTKIAR